MAFASNLTWEDAPARGSVLSRIGSLRALASIAAAIAALVLCEIALPMLAPPATPEAVTSTPAPGTATKLDRHSAFSPEIPPPAGASPQPFEIAAKTFLEDSLALTRLCTSGCATPAAVVAEEEEFAHVAFAGRDRPGAQGFSAGLSARPLSGPLAQFRPAAPVGRSTATPARIEAPPAPAVRASAPAPAPAAPAPAPAAAIPARTVAAPIAAGPAPASAPVPAPVPDRSAIGRSASPVPTPANPAPIASADASPQRLQSHPAVGLEPGVAIYDISAATVYMPDGERLEAHSGMGRMVDDPRYADRHNAGPTPPNTYDLVMRRGRFHGVEALRLLPASGNNKYGRVGLLAHTYLLRGRPAESNGCVAFKNYSRFLAAFKRGEIKQLLVVPSLPAPPVHVASSGR